MRALLAARKLLQSKLIDVELSIRGTLRGFGLKMGKISKVRFEARVVELVEGHAMLEGIMAALPRSSPRCIARSWPSSERARSASG